MKLPALLLSAWPLLAGTWHLDRDPFFAAEGYRTTQAEQPVRTRGSGGIRPLGVILSPGGAREVILNIEPEGVCVLKEKETRKVDLLDGRTSIRVEAIGEDHVVLSINRGEGVRYEIR